MYVYIYNYLGLGKMLGKKIHHNLHSRRKFGRYIICNNLFVEITIMIDTRGIYLV